MKIDIRKIIIAFSVVIIVWLLSGILTMNSMDVYEQLNKPYLNPPGYIFAIVWPILYLLMGLSFYLILISDLDNKESINIFILQLLFNFFWPILFFLFDFYLFSSAWLLVLIILIGYTMYQFYKINKVSSLLLIPYFIWCIFALYLNFSIYLLN
ncbi:MAG: TspO/MBR family protein [bacterium]